MQKNVIVLFSIIFSSHCGEYKFPDDFKFGVGTAAYQVEGAWNTSGKGESNWDRLTHSDPELISDSSNGDIACDSYSKAKEDVQLLKYLGVDFYRFSIAWSRILPNGRTDSVNPDGIRYYNELIDELLANGIEPMVAMHHFDLPQALEDKGGFMNVILADYFMDYASVLYENFGDRVKTWITFIEPVKTCYLGYDGDFFPPRANLEDAGGYLCGRTLLLAHAKAYHLYNDDYKRDQGGQVGITNVNFWIEPIDDKDDEQRKSSEAAQEYFFGWFTNPIFSDDGDYVPFLKHRIAQVSQEESASAYKLQEFTPEEIKFIKGSADFFGFSHHTTMYCADTTRKLNGKWFQVSNVGAQCIINDDVQAPASLPLTIIPWGFRQTLNWIKNKYKNPKILITGYGYSDVENILHDCRRVNYYNAYLTDILKAINEDGCNISGYTASFLDGFEWRSGYTEKSGLYSVDFNDPNRPRVPKMSAHVFKNIIETKNIDWSYTPDDFTNCKWPKKIHNLGRDDL